MYQKGRKTNKREACDLWTSLNFEVLHSNTEENTGLNKSLGSNTVWKKSIGHFYSMKWRHLGSYDRRKILIKQQTYSGLEVENTHQWMISVFDKCLKQAHTMLMEFYEYFSKFFKSLKNLEKLLRKSIIKTFWNPHDWFSSNAQTFRENKFWILMQSSIKEKHITELILWTINTDTLNLVNNDIIRW